MNSTECSEINESLEKYYLTPMYALEFIFGFTGNSIVVFGYIFCLQNWRSGNIYLFNLTLSDLAFLCTLPMIISYYSKGTWSYEPIWCQINRFLLLANVHTSILFLTFISIDRYLLMKYPFQNHFLQKKRTAIVLSIAVWILVILELSPIFIFLGIHGTSNGGRCTDYASSGNAVQSLAFSVTLTIVGFIIPLCIMCFFYRKILTFLKNRSSQMTAAMPLEKPLTLIIMAVAIFSLLFTPYHIMRNVRIASRTDLWNVSQDTCELIKIIYVITRPIAFLNSVINPVFYFLMGDHFREMLMKKVRHLLKICPLQNLYCKRG